MQVDLKGLAAEVDTIREELLAEEDEERGVDHRPGILYTAADCLRQAEQLERDLADVKRRARTAGQLLIEEIGAAGPEDCDVTAERAVEALRKERERSAELVKLVEKYKPYKELYRKCTSDLAEARAKARSR